ncbi:hypothetical protein ACFV0H_40060 [Streptomyces erythrochromogenes]|uniref:hypothetical protein n=1 Tax=Streptomyces erythrochromogenes TaxID=285574 RepID=UPI003690B77F
MTMSPHCAGLHFPDELRPGPERKPGVNLKLTPAETLELRTMLTHHHLPRPPERSSRGR